jgi:hypothetical protein
MATTNLPTVCRLMIFGCVRRWYVDTVATRECERWPELNGAALDLGQRDVLPGDCV